MSETQDAWLIRVLNVNPSVFAESGAVSLGVNSAKEEVPASARGAVAYAKSRLAWLSTRQSISTQFEDFVRSLADQYADEGTDSVVRELLRERLEPIMATFDETLADRLDDVVNEADPVRRDAFIVEVRSIITRYQDYVANEQMLAAMDDNPFAPTAIRKTLIDTLENLSAAVR